MGLHELQPFPGSKKRAKRVGRGHGSGHGTTATRGTKGQRARSGVSGLKIRGLRQTLRRIPKLRGFKSIHPKPLIVNVGVLSATFENGTIITPRLCAQKKLINLEKGTKNEVKILGMGDMAKKLTVQGFTVSQGAREKIEKAGGVIK
jgi:large subunit ribosomal protein L15